MELGKEIKSGGEGTVFEIKDDDRHVAKIYLRSKLSSDPDIANKIEYMIKNKPDESVLGQIAWPIDLITDQNGRFVGFTMPRLNVDTDLKSIYKYPPSSKLKLNSEHKIIIAYNISSVISAVHKAGYVFGDFNPLNIGINLSSGHVAFFDTDSFHFKDKRTGHQYKCVVGADGYIAPELIKHIHDTGGDFSSAPSPTFTKETDEFALAVHIYKLLMNGFSPFNGIKESQSASQSSPGTGNIAIERDNYCFKAGNKPQSPAVPDISCLSPNIQNLFKETFIDGVQYPSMRATADEWKQAIAEYKNQQRQCSRGHYYYIGNKRCPYCEADDRYQNTIAPLTNSHASSSGGVSQMSFSNPVIPTVNVSQKNINPTVVPPSVASKNQTTQSSSQIQTAKRRSRYPQRHKSARVLLILLFFVALGAVALKYHSQLEKSIDELRNLIQDTDSKEVDLMKLEPLESGNVELNNREPYTIAGQTWNNTMLFRAQNNEGWGMPNASGYVVYDLEGKYSLLQFKIAPYITEKSFHDGEEALVFVSDMGTSKILYSNSVFKNSGIINVALDVTGIHELRIQVCLGESSNEPDCIMSDAILYSLNAETDGIVPENDPVTQPDWENLVSIQDMKLLQHKNVNTPDEEPGWCYTDDEEWTHPFRFMPDDTSDAYMEYALPENYATMEFHLIPIPDHLDLFDENSVAVIKISDPNSSKVYYENTIDYNTRLSESIDISGANTLRIEIDQQTGPAQCLMQNIYFAKK